MKKQKRLKCHVLPRMYVKYADSTLLNPIAFAYGERWVGQAMLMDDMAGYKTPEEAKEAWRRRQNDHGRT